MTALNKEMIHYVKFDIKQWLGPKERLKVNQSMALTTVQRQQYFSWAFTQQRREWKNSVQGADDEFWEGWNLAIEFWDRKREEFGRDVKLWIGKPTYKKYWIAGQKQNLERLSESVAVLSYLPDLDQISMMVIQQEWVDEFTFIDSSNEMYNKTWSWQNPNTSIVRSVRKGDWQ